MRLAEVQPGLFLLLLLCFSLLPQPGRPDLLCLACTRSLFLVLRLLLRLLRLLLPL